MEEDKGFTVSWKNSSCLATQISVLVNCWGWERISDAFSNSQTCDISAFEEGEILTLTWLVMIHHISVVYWVKMAAQHA